MSESHTEPPSAVMDSDEYPTREFLDWLRAAKDAQVALRAASGFFEQNTYGSAHWTSRGGNWRLTLTTGGWSGCEDVLEALRDNVRIWNECWLEHHRGGKWVFEYVIAGGDT